MNKPDRIEAWLDAKIEATKPGPFPKQDFYNLLRWIGFIPAAFLGYGAMQLFTLVQSFLGPWIPSVIVRLMSAILCPYAFMLIGVSIAPSHKLVAATCLAAIHTGICVLLLTFAFTLAHYSAWDRAEIVIAAVIGLAVAIWLCVKTSRGTLYDE
jgi:hypothetical protein